MLYECIYFMSAEYFRVRGFVSNFVAASKARSLVRHFTNVGPFFFKSKIGSTFTILKEVNA